jgi:2-oxoglutarate ferredoxin oxidoreductase subunit alpha
MERLAKKFETAKSLVPAPILKHASRKTDLGVIYFGSTSPAMHEAADMLAAKGVHLDLLRVRGFPFASEVTDFIAEHERVFVVEQNKDAQLRTLLMVECGIDPAQLMPILHYDGNPITARFVTKAIGDAVNQIQERAIP